MNRRDFLAAGLAGLAGAASPATAQDAKEGGQRDYYEFRVYQTHVGSKKDLLGDFLRDVGIAAMNKIGVGPIGVFNVVYGQNAPSLYMLLVHKSLESVVTATQRLLDDKEFQKAAAGHLDAPLSDPQYVRCESSLMVAFKGMPQLAVPQKKGRIFELRTYESHSIKAAMKKIEMFNEGGEIAIFKKTGLNPVFFGQTLIGQRLPNLTYMLVFDDMADRDNRWAVFGKDPDWVNLRAKEEYKDTVSNVTDIILRPTSYSQV